MLRGTRLPRSKRARKSHAIFAAGDDERLQIQVAQGALAQIFELARVGADSRVVGGFEFRLVGSGGGDACVAKIEQAVTRIECEAAWR